MRWVLGGLVVLTGIGVGWYMGANDITPSAAGQAAQQAFGGIGSLVKSMEGNVQSASVNLGDKLPGSSAKDTGQAGQAASLGGHGTSGPVAVRSGSGSSGGHSRSGIGAGSVADAVTTDNAPAPDPTIIGGVPVKYDPYKPSDGPYPTLAANEHVWVDVSIDQQLLYILNGNRVIYTMVTSTGLDTDSDDSTPLGVYHVQSQRGTWFYSQQYSEGAQYWTSWLGHGVFLFHTVPMDSQQQIIPEQAALLGHKASHGCFHLTIPDAQWIYHNIPEGTTVVVEQAPVALQNARLYQPSAQQLAAVQTPYVNPAGTQGGTTGPRAGQESQPPQNAKV